MILESALYEGNGMASANAFLLVIKLGLSSRGRKSIEEGARKSSK